MNRKFAGAFYFSLTVITTIGYGHSTPQTFWGKMFCMIYATIGIPLCLVMFQSVGDKLNFFAAYCIQMVKKCSRVKNTEVNQFEKVVVAGLLAVFTVTVGAAMFSHYEGWTYFNSIYFCVITLTTIGFGDYVALQQDKNNLSNTTYVILSLTFILFGLTVISSLINLVVLKFLTMNTVDEGREVSRRADAKSKRMSSSGLINVINGDILCNFEAKELENLKKENSFRFFVTKKLNASTLLRNNTLGSRLTRFLTPGSAAAGAGAAGSTASSPAASHANANASSNAASAAAAADYTIHNSCGSGSHYANKSDGKHNHTTETCIETHYTVRRGPSQISHLVASNMFINNSCGDLSNCNNNNMNNQARYRSSIESDCVVATGVDEATGPSNTIINNNDNDNYDQYETRIDKQNIYNITSNNNTNTNAIASIHNNEDARDDSRAHEQCVVPDTHQHQHHHHHYHHHQQQQQHQHDLGYLVNKYIDEDSDRDEFMPMQTFSSDRLNKKCSNKKKKRRSQSKQCTCVGDEVTCPHASNNNNNSTSRQNTRRHSSATTSSTSSSMSLSSSKPLKEAKV